MEERLPNVHDISRAAAAEFNVPLDNVVTSVHGAAVTTIIHPHEESTKEYMESIAQDPCALKYELRLKSQNRVLAGMVSESLHGQESINGLTTLERTLNPPDFSFHPIDCERAVLYAPPLNYAYGQLSCLCDLSLLPTFIEDPKEYVKSHGGLDLDCSLCQSIFGREAPRQSLTEGMEIGVRRSWVEGRRLQFAEGISNSKIGKCWSDRYLCYKAKVFEPFDLPKAYHNSAYQAQGYRDMYALMVTNKKLHSKKCVFRRLVYQLKDGEEETLKLYEAFGQKCRAKVARKSLAEMVLYDFDVGRDKIGILLRRMETEAEQQQKAHRNNSQNTVSIISGEDTVRNALMEDESVMDVRAKSHALMEDESVMDLRAKSHALMQAELVKEAFRKQESVKGLTADVSFDYVVATIHGKIVTTIILPREESKNEHTELMAQDPLHDPFRLVWHARKLAEMVRESHHERNSIKGLTTLERTLNPPNFSFNPTDYEKAALYAPPLNYALGQLSCLCDLSLLPTFIEDPKEYVKSHGGLDLGCPQCQSIFGQEAPSRILTQGMEIGVQRSWVEGRRLQFAEAISKSKAGKCWSDQCLYFKAKYFEPFDLPPAFHNPAYHAQGYRDMYALMVINKKLHSKKCVFRRLVYQFKDGEEETLKLYEAFRQKCRAKVARESLAEMVLYDFDVGPDKTGNKKTLRRRKTEEEQQKAHRTTMQPTLHVVSREEKVMKAQLQIGLDAAEKCSGSSAALLRLLTGSSQGSNPQKKKSRKGSMIGSRKTDTVRPNHKYCKRVGYR